MKNLDEDEYADQPVSLADPERFALLTHDIRSTIADVLSGLQLIGRDTLPPMAQMQIDRLRVSADHLARLLEDGLSAIMGPTGIEPSENAPVDLQLVLHGIARRWTALTHDAGQNVVIALVADGLPQTVWLDRLALERTLSNFLSNAVRHCGAGTITLHATLNAADDLVFSVRDQGDGFPAHVLADLTRKTDVQINSGLPGSGLGLRIAQDQAARMGGRVEARNAAGGGALVHLILPRTAWVQSDAGGAISTLLPDLTGLRGLVAEDSKTGQLLLNRFLMQMGAACQVVGNGTQAQRILERERFDFAIIDIEMPIVSGLTVAQLRRTIEDRQGQARLPLIAVTSHALPGDRRRILSTGFDDMITKPVLSVVQLGMVLSDLLGVPRTTPEPVPNDPATPTLSHVSNRLAHLIDMAGTTQNDLLSELHSDLTNGRKGLLAALDADDRDGLRRFAHMIGAVAGTIGAQQLHEQAQFLEHGIEGNAKRVFAPLAQTIAHDLTDLIDLIQTELDTRDTARQ